MHIISLNQKVINLGGVTEDAGILILIVVIRIESGASRRSDIGVIAAAFYKVDFIVQNLNAKLLMTPFAGMNSRPNPFCPVVDIQAIKIRDGEAVDGNIAGAISNKNGRLHSSLTMNRWLRASSIGRVGNGQSTRSGIFNTEHTIPVARFFKQDGVPWDEGEGIYFG